MIERSGKVPPQEVPMVIRASGNGAHRRRVLVIGSWAKEQISIENIRRGGSRVHAYTDTANPAIAAAADEHTVGPLTDRAAIVDAARRTDSDLVLITTASPLASGAADALEEAGITTFGPRRAAARLESNKAFMRSLLERARIDASPAFRVCSTTEEAEAFAADLGWQVAVKPLGLTDGLGVQVTGDHLRDDDDVRAAIAEAVGGRYDDDRRVLLEQRLVGEEFTIQCFVHGETVIPTPPVQDFKRLLRGDEGPNTGSMGSYTAADGSLPFLGDGDLESAHRILHATVDALREIEGLSYTGFLYGQFVRTAAGVRLIEYNVRPGDPEWLNTVGLLEDDLVDLVQAVLRNEPVEPRFRPGATACAYVTPPDYPRKRDCVLEASADEAVIARHGARLYHSCGVVDGVLRVGGERGLAVLAEGRDVPGARRRVLDAIEQGIRGRFHHRTDIGSREMIETKEACGETLRATRVRIRRFRPADAAEVVQLLQASPPLEPYPLHLLLIAQRCFGRTCWVAEIGGEIVGWLMGLGRNDDPGCWFLWQIGVRPSAQRRGVAKRLLRHAEAELVASGYERIEVTVAPDNRSSLALFRSAGYGTCRIDGSSLTVDGETVAAHHYGPGRHFVLLEKTLPAIDTAPVRHLPAVRSAAGRVAADR
jgi:phosphoribosylamine--glycine ligase